MKTVLITGGAGFIGSNFVHHLYNKYPDYRLLVVDALTYAGNVHNCPDGAMGSGRYEFWYGDVRNGELMDTLVGQSDIVVHMAAESHVTRSIYDNKLFFETDVLGTQAVANAIVKHRDRVERFIHISTSEVYGSALDEKMSEEHPLNPMSPYASAKCGADRLVYSYWATYDIPATIIRPFNNYGPYQHLEKAVPRFITSVLLLVQATTKPRQMELLPLELHRERGCSNLGLLESNNFNTGIPLKDRYSPSDSSACTLHPGQFGKNSVHRSDFLNARFCDLQV